MTTNESPILKKWSYRFQLNGIEYSGTCVGATNKKKLTNMKRL